MIWIWSRQWKDTFWQSENIQAVPSRCASLCFFVLFPNYWMLPFMMMVISAADDNCVHFFIIAQCEKRSLLFVKGSSQTNSRVSCSCEHVHGRRLVRAGKRPRWSRGSEGSLPCKSVFKWGEKDEQVLCKKHRNCSWFSLIQSWLHYPSFFHWMTWVCLSFNWWVWAPSTLTMSFYCHLLDKCKTAPSAPSAP